MVRFPSFSLFGRMLSGILRSSNSDTDSEGSSDMSSSYCWISWFVAQPGNDFLLEVEEDFIRDNFNLYGLRQMFHFYDHALEMILDPECPDEEDLGDREFAEIYRDAAELYGLIHQRFALSPRGLAMLKEKYLSSEFGQCPRLLCQNQTCLPIGLRDDPRQSMVKVFCPKCEQVYTPENRHVANLDGAYFGTSLPHMLLQTYPDLVPLELPVPFEPRIFGFKIHGQRSVVRKKMDSDRAGIRFPRKIDLATLPPDDFDQDST
jgi:casein kinase II subunit beta